MGAAQRIWMSGTDIPTRLHIVTVPDNDEKFRLEVRGALVGIDDHRVPSTSALVSALEQLLPRYPQLEIRQQNGLASFNAEPNTWYVYRNGTARIRSVD